MFNRLSKNLSLVVLLAATLALLSLMLLHLRHPQTEKTTTENIEYKKPRPHGMLKAALMPHQSDLEFCYESFLKTKPVPSEGAVTVHWLVNSDGVVLSTELGKNELTDASFTDCLLEKLKNMSFPAPPEGRQMILSYKFHFRREPQASLKFEE